MAKWHRDGSYIERVKRKMNGQGPSTPKARKMMGEEPSTLKARKVNIQGPLCPKLAR